MQYIVYLDNMYILYTIYIVYTIQTVKNFATFYHFYPVFFFFINILKDKLYYLFLIKNIQKVFVYYR